MTVSSCLLSRFIFIALTKAFFNGSDTLPATANTSVVITITDKNDNAPEKGFGWNPTLCETPSAEMKRNITVITAIDKDSTLFTPLLFERVEKDSKFILENSGKKLNEIEIYDFKSFLFILI